MNVFDYFPYSSFRPNQESVISQIVDAIDNGYRNIIVDAPTGFGKSGVVRTINDYLVNEKDFDSYILTATKNLQRQYWSECQNTDNVDYQMALGRNNYQCLVNGKTCDRGRCKESSVSEKYRCIYGARQGNPCENQGCNYWEAKCANICSDTSIMNYNVLMTDLQYVHHYPYRNITFCDEAHNIEHKIMNEVSVKFTEKQLSRLFDCTILPSEYSITDLDYWINFMEDIRLKAIERIDNINESFTPVAMDTLEKMKRFENQLRWKIQEIKHGANEWVVCPNYRERSIEIKPITVRGFLHTLLLNASEVHVFLSGSFIDIDQWTSDLGLDFKYHYIKTKSSFDMENNNPIYRKWVGNMAMKQKEKTLPKMVKAIENILDKHSDQCGIIHCHSRENAMYLLKHIKSGRLITYNNSLEKEEKLKVFERSNSLVMLGYSLEEGVDLPYDNVRFQIFVKTPFANLGDNQVRERMKIDRGWYQINTARKIIQAWGRGMRAEDDFCENYLLDTGFNAIIKQPFMPEEFVGAIK